jgi:CubicO group peptidase (beta-lactamase class C family)
MLTRRPVLIGLGMTAAAWCARALAAQDTLTGTWTGILNAGVKLRLKWEIAADGTVTMYSLDQGNRPISGKATSMTPERLEIDVSAIKGSYTGRAVSADRLEGTWKQGGNELPLTLRRGDAGLAPEPVQPLTQVAIEEMRAKANAPALAAAAVSKGRPAQKWATGERVKGSGNAVTGEDLWHLGSITKSMTATLVARCVEQGTVKWDDTIGEVLKDIAPDMRAEYQPATFRHLLCHRAGLQNVIAPAELVKFSRQLDDAREERRTYVRSALAQAPFGAMTTTFNYSNSGFVIAGAMLEARLGKPWEELIRAHLFQPLQLTSAGFGAPGAKGPVTQPMGHVPYGGALFAQTLDQPITDNPVVIGPAGRVHMSLDDVLTYLAAHRDGASLLKPESWKTLHTPPFGGDYAMGWVVRPDGLWHNGSNTMWMANVLFNSSTGVAGVAATNYAAPSSGPLVGDVLERAIRAVQG